jgi:hypothetical protein
MRLVGAFEAKNKLGRLFVLLSREKRSPRCRAVGLPPGGGGGAVWRIDKRSKQIEIGRFDWFE